MKIIRGPEMPLGDPGWFILIRFPGSPKENHDTFSSNFVICVMGTLTVHTLGPSHPVTLLKYHIKPQFFYRSHEQE